MSDKILKWIIFILLPFIITSLLGILSNIIGLIIMMLAKINSSAILEKISNAFQIKIHTSPPLDILPFWILDILIIVFLEIMLYRALKDSNNFM